MEKNIKKKNVSVYNWVTVLDSRDWHSIVNQLYFNFKTLLKPTSRLLGWLLFFFKYENNKCWWRCGETGTLAYHWWESKMVQLLQKRVWRFLKKIKNRTTIWSGNSTSGIPHPKELKAGSWRDLHTYVHSNYSQ